MTTRLSARSAGAIFVSTYEESSSFSHHTLRAYRNDIGQFVSQLPKGKPLASVTVADVEAWLASLAREQYAPASRRRKLASLRVFFNHFERKGTILTSPLSSERIRIPQPQHLPRALELREARAIIALVRHEATIDPSPSRLRDRAMVEVLLSTGIRVGELVALSCADYLQGDGALRIKGKGNRERLAPLADRSSREALHGLMGSISSEPSAPLFTNQRGGRLTAQGVAYVLRRVALEAGILKRVTPHMLRHTAATLLLLNGADIRIVQDFLGHASIATTQIYTRLSQARLRDALAKHHHGKLLAG